MAVKLPASLRRRSDVEAIFEDIAPYIGTTVEQRMEIMEQLCEWAAEQIAAHPRGAEILAYQEPRSPESLDTWRKLVARSRNKK